MDLKDDVVKALREASCFGMPWSFREHLQDLARKVEQEPDWRGVAGAVLLGLGGEEVALHGKLVGDATAKAFTGLVEAKRDSGSVVVRLREMPRFKPSGV